MVLTGSRLELLLHADMFHGSEHGSPWLLALASTEGPEGSHPPRVPGARAPIGRPRDPPSPINPCSSLREYFRVLSLSSAAFLTRADLSLLSWSNSKPDRLLSFRRCREVLWMEKISTMPNQKDKNCKVLKFPHLTCFPMNSKHI